MFQIFLIYIKLTTLTTFLSKLVQFICYHSVITNNKAMPKENSEFVTLAILKEMLAAQERAYKTTTQLLVDDMRSEIRSLRSEVDELKESVKFTSAKYEELKEKSQKVESKLEVDMRAVYRQIEGLSENLRQGLEVIEDKNEYLENQSRRNNIRILGVEETEDEKSWDDTEKVVKDLLKKKLNILGEVYIERAHRVGKKTKAGRHLGNASQSREQKPRPIIAKISSWKVKENILREARRKRPEDIMFLHDLSKRTLERRQELIPEMLEARKQGKIAYMVMDKLIIHDRKKPDDDNSDDEVFVNANGRQRR